MQKLITDVFQQKFTDKLPTPSTTSTIGSSFTENDITVTVKVADNYADHDDWPRAPTGPKDKRLPAAAQPAARAPGTSAGR